MTTDNKMANDWDKGFHTGLKIGMVSVVTLMIGMVLSPIILSTFQDYWDNTSYIHKYFESQRDPHEVAKIACNTDYVYNATYDWGQGRWECGDWD